MQLISLARSWSRCRRPSSRPRRGRQIGYEFSAELQYYAIGAHFAAEALPQLSQHS